MSTSPTDATPATPSLFRFAAMGSVDDGKSTLIGRLLHDSRAIARDQLDALEAASRRRGRDGIDLSLLTDGLRAEREQGITIDVAYRSFGTANRRFIIADTPGHAQYTRNAVTGCSTADLAIVLVDARHGVVEQTRRHIVAAALLRVPCLAVAVNKMDLVDWSASAFGDIRSEIEAIAIRLGIRLVATIPVSALRGDNVVGPAASAAWYDGPTVLELLETVEPRASAPVGLRLPIQSVIRDPADPDHRAFAGRIEEGGIRVGQDVLALPGRIRTVVRAIDAGDEPLAVAAAPRSVAIRLADPVDLGRGGLLVDPGNEPPARRTLVATVCWLADEPMSVDRRYWLHHTTRAVRASVTSIDHRLDVATLEADPDVTRLGPNEVGRARFALSEPIFADVYGASRRTGGAILIDEASHATVAAVLIEDDDPDLATP